MLGVGGGKVETEMIGDRSAHSELGTPMIGLAGVRRLREVGREIADGDFGAVADVEDLSDTSWFIRQRQQSGYDIADPGEAAAL